MNEVQVAIYARVSSEQQSDAKTIESQVGELRAHIKSLGLSLPVEHEFLDDGYSGATLIRPGLERLRDVVATGGIDQLYVHCPDRLARNYARSASCSSKNLSTLGSRCIFSIGRSVRPQKINSSSRFKA